ncbi:MAG: DUF4837 family protein [Bacteroidales bacterium]|nr:DUF4837 family protein [Bacteroidales bacterium]
MKKGILLIAIILSFVTCETNDKKLLPGSIGRFNELMVIVNHTDWEGKIGIELKKVIASNVLGLPQPEPQFAVTHIPHKGFNGFLKHNRNILSIEKSDEAAFVIQYNVYAKNQTYIHIKGPDQQAIIKLIKENSDAIISSFKESDLKQIQKRLRKKIHKKETVKTFTEQGFSLNIPLNYSLIDDTGDFVWFRKRIEDYGYKINGSMNIIAYSLPLDIPFEQIKDSIVGIRDAIGKKYIPGTVEGSYLITEAAYTPHVFDAKIDNKRAYKVKGKWEVYNEFMAGPFVSYTIEDLKGKRLIVVEGFIYAPVVKKRDFIFEQEAIIRSVHIE